MSVPVPDFDGAGDGWIMDSADPRLDVLWPGAQDYGDDLAVPLYAAAVQCAEFAPLLADTTPVFGDWATEQMQSGYTGLVVAHRVADSVEWACSITNTSGSVKVGGQVFVGVPADYRPEAATFLEYGDGALSMRPNGQLDFSWGSWPDGELREFIVTGKTAPVEPGIVVPENYVAAQVLQCRALVRAGVVGSGDQTGGYGETVTVFPMDWTVKALLRPRRGKPYLGGRKADA